MFLKTKRKIIEKYSNFPNFGFGTINSVNNTVSFYNNQKNNIDKNLDIKPIGVIKNSFNNTDNPIQLSKPVAFKPMSDSDIVKAKKNIHKVTGSHDTNFSLWWREKSKLQKTGIIVASLAVIGLVGWGVTKVIK